MNEKAVSKSKVGAEQRVIFLDEQFHSLGKRNETRDKKVL